jgi:ubiquinone/menaquinone biosynthesis C-methylase UbiE
MGAATAEVPDLQRVSAMTRPLPSTPEYAFGYSESEQQRLISQAAYYGALTEALFRRAGLQPGMHVLDVGCGAGDVSLLAAALVGPTGSVLGVDTAASSVAFARQRARAAGLEHVAFRQSEIAALEPDRQFDALVGRFVLMYLADPAATLARLLRFVRPGGLVVFQEIEISMVRTVPEAPLFLACREWIRETLRRAGFTNDMGSQLYPTFLRAGLPGPEMILAGRVEGGAGSPVYPLIAETVRSLLPMMERLGVATAETVQPDTLATRLKAEVCAGGGVVIPPPLIGAWARKPGC